MLHDDRRIYPNVYTAGRIENLGVISQGGVVYNEPLKRYVYTSWTAYTFEFYESPMPWGPWKRMDAKDFGGYPWTHAKHGGYATTIPSKYISADGRSMWLQANVCPCGGGYPQDDNWAYTFSLRKLRLEPFAPSTPSNGADRKGRPFRHARLLQRREQAAERGRLERREQVGELVGPHLATPVHGERGHVHDGHDVR